MKINKTSKSVFRSAQLIILTLESVECLMNRVRLSDWSNLEWRLFMVKVEGFNIQVSTVFADHILTFIQKECHCSRQQKSSLGLCSSTRPNDVVEYGNTKEFQTNNIKNYCDHLSV